MTNQLTLIQPTTWPVVFADWKTREADHWGWEAVWRERGSASWEAWRSQYTERFGLDARTWGLHRVDDPAAFVPALWVGAFKGWRRYFPEDAMRATMGQIASHPDLAENGKVKGILEHPPSATTIIAVRLGEEFVVVEGLHRCAAIALAAERGEPLPIALTLHLTTLTDEERSLFDEARTQEAA